MLGLGIETLTCYTLQLVGSNIRYQLELLLVAHRLTEWRSQSRLDVPWLMTSDLGLKEFVPLSDDSASIGLET